jgi:hypothetical protein
MGSIGCHRQKGLSDKEFFEGEYEMEILDTSRIGGVIYAAAKHRKLTMMSEPGEVFALVMPFTFDRNGYFVWKEQDETCGPYDTRCPDRILDLLTETDSGNAKDWRAACRAHNDQERAAREHAKKVTQGTVIRLAEALTFSNGGKYDTFRYSGKRNGFTALDADGWPVAMVSLSGWKMRAYEVNHGD